MCVAIPVWTIPGWLSYLGIPGCLDKGGHVCGHPWTIPGWLSYLGIPGYLDKGGGVCVWPFLDNPGMAKLLGNPGMLGQGGACVMSRDAETWEVPSHVSVSLDIPHMGI